PTRTLPLSLHDALPILVEGVRDLLTPLGSLINENLVSVVVNVQEEPGDFTTEDALDEGSFTQRAVQITLLPQVPLAQVNVASATDRKSTRLNSSHVRIS